jgi:hypothetical protein
MHKKMTGPRLLLLFFFLLTQVGFAQNQYCIAGPLSNRGGEISGVRLVGESQSINFSQPCLGIPFVNSQVNNAIADLRPGNGYTLEVDYISCFGGQFSATSVYLDFNQNGVFEPMEELDSRIAIANPHTQQFHFWVPINAPSGKTTLRILMVDDQFISLPINPCFSSITGSVADFSVYITETGSCTTPTANQALANKTSICPGDSVRLSANSVSFGPGISHQWESSLDNNLYDNVPGGHQVFFQTGPITTNIYYRLRVQCGIQTVYSQPIFIRALHDPLPIGNYEINNLLPTGGLNFNSFEDLLTRIHCAGILGPISVAVAPGTGPYQEQIVMRHVPGANATNKIYINGRGETVQWLHESGNVYGVVNLTQAQYYHLDSLTIKALNPQVGYGIHLMAGSHYNQITHCEIEMGFANVNPDLHGIFGGDMNNSPQGNHILGNRIIGGRSGITLMGNFNNLPGLGNIIQDNDIVDFNGEGISISNQSNAIISGNHFRVENHPTPRSSQGIRLAGQMEGAQITKNQFYAFGIQTQANFQSLFYGTSLFSSSANPIVIANNVGYEMGRISNFRGFEMTNIENIKILNNTILLTDSNRPSNNISMVRVYGSNDGLEVANNIFFVETPGTTPVNMLEINGTGEIDINHNVYYVSDTARPIRFVNQTAPFNSFRDWQRKNRFGWDLFSVNANPLINTSLAPLLRPTSAYVDNIGKPFPALVPNDNLDSVRSVFPDPGAFEFAGPPCAIPVQFVADSIFPDAVYLSWQQPLSSTSSWELFWDAVGSQPGAATGQTSIVHITNAGVTGLTPGSCMDFFLRALCPGPNPDSSVWVGPLTICLPYAHDLNLLRILQPTAQVRCGDEPNEVRLLVENNGITPINGATIRLNIQGAYNTDQLITIPNVLNPGARDSITIYQFSLPAGGQIHLSVAVEWSPDQNPANDTLSIDQIDMMASKPVVLNDQYCPGALTTTIKMESMPGAIHRWYYGPHLQFPFFVGDQYSIMVRDLRPYYVSYALDQKGILQTADFPQQITNHGMMFDLKPKKDLYLTGFDYKTVTSSGNPQTIRVYIADSTANHKHAEDWRLIHQGPIMEGAWRFLSFELDTPVFLQSGKSYGFYLDYETRITLGNQFFFNDDLEFHSGSYSPDAPFTQVSQGTFNGGIHYTLEGCESERIRIEPSQYNGTVTAQFDYEYETSRRLRFDASRSIGHQFSWEFGNGQSATGATVTHTFERTGLWDVKLTVLDTLCGQQTDTTLTIFVGKSDLEQNTLLVTPNPSNGLFQITMEAKDSGPIPYQIYDVHGKHIFSGTMQPKNGYLEGTLDLSNRPSGIYILKLDDDLAKQPTRLIKI